MSATLDAGAGVRVPRRLSGDRRRRAQPSDRDHLRAGQSVADAAVGLLRRDRRRRAVLPAGRGRDPRARSASCARAAQRRRRAPAARLARRRRAGPRAAARAGAARVIVATNIAETSLTVPGVTAVIDTGLHKVARYDAERGIDSLETERITADAADQRAGRAGRLAPGVRAPAVGRARSPAPAPRAGDSPRRSRRRRCSTCSRGAAIRGRFEWFERPRDGRARGGPDPARAPRRDRDGGPLTRRSATVTAAACRCIRGWRACWSSRRRAPDARRPARCSRSGICCRRAAATTDSDLLSAARSGGERAVARAAGGDEVGLADCSVRASGVARPYRRAELRRAHPRRLSRSRGAAARAGLASVLLASGTGAVLGARERRPRRRVPGRARGAGEHRPRLRGAVRVASRVEREWLEPDRDATSCIASTPATGTVRAASVDRYDALVAGGAPGAGRPGDRGAACWPAPGSRTDRADEDARLLRRLRFAGLDVDLDALVRGGRLRRPRAARRAHRWRARAGRARAPRSATRPSR